MLVVTHKRLMMMPWLNWVSAILFIIGIGLFLYGANIYNATAGWTGFCLSLTGILLCVANYLYGQLSKKEPKQTTI